MRVLVINTGSATLKYKLVRTDGAAPEVLASGREALAGGHADAVRGLLADLPAAPDLVAHRVVHGGDRFGELAEVNEAILRDLEETIPLDPLHNAPALAGIRATLNLGIPVVAAFDTAFHQNMPEVASRYALPALPGIRRYGFHGWSFRSVVERYGELTGNRNPTLVVLHLGSGASAAAIRAGRSVDTSMGMSPLEGLVMGTRPGDLDAGVLLHLLRRGYSEEALVELLYRRSGLLGLAGESDVERLLAREDEEARFALEMFCYRARKYLGAYLAVLEGDTEAVVFTGGIGQNSGTIRRRIAAPFRWAGIRLEGDGDYVTEGPISAPDSSPAVWVIPTREEEAIASAASRLVAGRRPPAP